MTISNILKKLSPAFSNAHITVRSLTGLTFFVGSMLLVGCGETKTISIAPASGVVNIDGAPAANIMVQFLPQVSPGEEGPTSTGITDSEGRFELKTLDGEVGAMVGRSKVLLTDIDEERPAQGEERTRPERLHFGFSVISQTTLEVDVKDENEPFVFDVGL